VAWAWPVARRRVRYDYTASLRFGVAELPDVLSAAMAHADAAAAAAGVRVELVEDPQRLHAVAELLATVWATAPGQGPLPHHVLRAVAHSGGAVHVAYGSGGPVGAAAAIFGPPEARSAYSLIAAASRSDRGTGFALKQAQRAWALQLGVTSLAWTFDPLVRRNARFNLVKLGAVAREYLVNFYGPLDDAMNAGDETDRLMVVWSLTGPRAGEAAQGRTAEPGSPGNAASGAAPDAGPLAAYDADGLWCRVPADIVALRRADPGLAAQWRVAVRNVLRPAMAAGLVATGMSRDGWYRLTREERR
jgi:predicted GNAT superfamily acetyltransferase